MNDKEVVIVGAVRTPFGRFGGVLKDVPSIELGAFAIEKVLERAGCEPGNVDQLYYGTCIPAETALETNIPARQAMLKAGLPPETLSLTIDRACCSSMTAVHLGWQAIALGKAECVIAAGSENMSRAALMARGARWGKKLGGIMLEDPLYELGYREWNPVSVDAGQVALEYGIDRKAQDEWAYRSQQYCAAAENSGKFDDERIAFQYSPNKGKPVSLDKDEFPKPQTTIEGLSKLGTVYGSPTVTPGNAPGLDTGAAAILLMSGEKAKQLGLVPLARVAGLGSVSREPRLIATVPAPAIQEAMANAGLTLNEIDLIEINEAFAAMPLVSSKILADGDEAAAEKIREKINVKGGAIALGHPVGASGARILMTMIYELRQKGGGNGVAAICGGLAQGDSVAVTVD